MPLSSLWPSRRATAVQLGCSVTAVGVDERKAENSSPVAFECLGVRWTVDLSAYRDPDELLSSISELWARCRVEARGDEHTFRPIPHAVTDAGADSPVVPDDPRPSFPYDFSRALTRWLISIRAGSALILHAAALASHDGSRAVVMVGRSGAGKTTAAETLGSTFGYVTDELVAIEPDGTLSPYPKPLSRVPPGGGPKLEVSPDEMLLEATPSQPPELAAIVLLNRDADMVGAARLEPIRLQDALGEMITQSSSLWLQAHPLRRLCEALVRGGGPYILRYREIGDCTHLIDTLFSAADHRLPFKAVPPFGGQKWVAPAGTTERLGAALLVDQMIVRAPWTDAVEVDEHTVVLMQGPRPAMLTGIGPEIWYASRSPIQVRDIVAAVERAHGKHPGAEHAVISAIHQLLISGVLSRTGTA